MDQISSRDRFRKILFWFTTIFLAFHILLALASVFFTINFLPRKITSFYTKLVVLGPFFTDARITTSPHVYISKHNSSVGWSPMRDIGYERFLEFQHQLWRFDKLKWSDYERSIAFKAYAEVDSLKQIDGSEGNFSKELIRYASLRVPAAVDSIKVLYIWNSWQIENGSVKKDTAFYVTFKPQHRGTPN